MATIAERQRHALKQEMLTVEQVALLTQYHPISIYRLIAQGKIEHVRIGPRTIRILRESIKKIRDRHPNADQTMVL